MMPKKLFILLMFMGLSGCLMAQNWAGILDPQRAIDWSNKGVSGGIPSRSTVCANLSPGVTAAQINSALSSCPAGEVVFLNAGTYNLSGGIHISNSNVTLRGAGPDQTFLVFTSYDSCNGTPNATICVTNPNGFNPTSPGQTANWTAGYTKGTTSITLDNVSGLAVGSVLVLDQNNDPNTDNGQIWVCNTAGVCSTEGGGINRNNRDQVQVVVVTGISGTTVNITPGLYMPNWRSSQAPGAYWTSVTSGVGIEALSIEGINSGALANIGIVGARDSWVKNVRSLHSNRANIYGMGSTRITVRDSYFFGTINAASQSYGIETDISSDWLVENNIFQQVTAPTPTGASVAGSVYGYNYSINDYYTNGGSPTGWMQSSQYHHSPGIDYHLFEGNDGAGFTADAIHGTQEFMTAFRNRWRGWEVGKTAQTVGVHIYAYNRYFNAIGNVLGQTGYHHTYECYATSATSSGCPTDDNIFVLGYAGNEGYCNNCGGAGSVNNDLMVRNSLMRWGNYDTVNAAARWQSSEVPSALTPYGNPVPASQTLPSSFYLPIKPNWWGNAPWPPFGPDVSGGSYFESGGSGVWASPNLGGHASMIPAALCYMNVMGGPADGTGSPLTFNANNCYASANAPAPPTNLTVVVQ